MKMAKLGLILLAILIHPAKASDTIDVEQISVESALKVALAALQTCRDRNAQVAVTVVGRYGAPIVVLRDPKTPDITLRLSKDKAYTALFFETPTQRLQAKHLRPLAQDYGLFIGGGGAPLRVGKKVIGGVGVAGSSLGTDATCAEAGARKLY